MSDLHQCPYCGQRARVVWVHGHGQCEICRINVDECCRGEVCQPPSVQAGSS